MAISNKKLQKIMTLGYFITQLVPQAGSNRRLLGFFITASFLKLFIGQSTAVDNLDKTVFKWKHAGSSDLPRSPHHSLLSQDPPHQPDLQIPSESIAGTGAALIETLRNESDSKVMQPCPNLQQVWLHEQADLRIEGRILGFDECLRLDQLDAIQLWGPAFFSSVWEASVISLGT